ncbi:DUF6776 family protein [Pseudomonas sp. 5P_3.1_Bac2]|uniref:DUF6776 family protein n=1 Tax=Pseudomonas sp. 5P_3.1_Bac2 TaxID=2971617 RepID=UPI0021C6FA7F|nr:DUF6776 family protein [Pseudomonas sp. 5P_3.1_Bac2]MCU1717495.1 hypothetical protein [Pseudomonas sp. 5P_3.1_Bac2]
MASWEVRPSDPRRERRRRFAIFALLLGLPLAFYAGMRYQQQLAPVAEPPAPPVTAAAPAPANDELEELRQRLAVLSNSANVSQQANEKSRLTIKLLEEQIYQQQQDLAFYQGVLAPEQRHQGLQIKAFELQGTENPQRFRYKILLSRIGKDAAPLAGQLEVSIQGTQDGKPLTLPLASLAEHLPNALSEQPIPFAFKHFQAIPAADQFAELQLPSGFEPKQIKVRAQVKGDKPLLHSFNWNKPE